VYKIGIIGLGYVGLTLTAALAQKSNEIFAFDNDTELTNNLKNGDVPFIENNFQSIFSTFINKKIFILNDLNSMPIVDFIFVCIGTPKSEMNHLNQFKELVKNIIDKSQHIILRSTLTVGTTSQLYTDLKLAKTSNYLSYCPERTIEGNAIQEIFDLPQIISSESDKGLLELRELFSNLGIEYIVSSNTKSAEMSKVICNVWRDYTFAFANELSVISSDLNLDVMEVVALSNYKYSRSRIPKPGPVGGPCLTKDTHILLHNLNHRSNFLFLMAREVNERVHENLINYFISQNDQYINRTILVLGLAFKGYPETDDFRNGAAVEFLDKIQLLKLNFTVRTWDPNISFNSKFSSFERNIDELISTANYIILSNNSPYFETDKFIDSVLKNSRDDVKIIDLFPLTKVRKELSSNMVLRKNWDSTTISEKE
jgi:UDP-N-acetyl-D-mannosaminuronic acid dehydrogenase